MGENRQEIKRNRKKAIATDGATETPSDRDTSTATPESGTDGTGRTTAPDTGTDGTRGRTPQKEKELPELPSVNIPVPETEKKTRKPRKTSKKNEKVDSSHLSALLMGTSAIVASRQGFEHWALNETECKQIAEPLMNMIEKSEALKSITEHSDGIALASACMMIFTPRIIITMSQAKEKKKQKEVIKNAVKSERNIKSDNRKPTATTPIIEPSITDELF